MSSLTLKIKTLSILLQKILKITKNYILNSYCSALFYMKSKAFQRYFVHSCSPFKILWIQSYFSFSNCFINQTKLDHFIPSIVSTWQSEVLHCVDSFKILTVALIMLLLILFQIKVKPEKIIAKCLSILTYCFQNDKISTEIRERSSSFNYDFFS